MTEKSTFKGFQNPIVNPSGFGTWDFILTKAINSFPNFLIQLSAAETTFHWIFDGKDLVSGSLVYKVEQKLIISFSSALNVNKAMPLTE